MNNRLLSLTLVLLIAMVAGYFVLQQQSPAQPSKPALFADLAAAVATVDEIRISDAQHVLLIAKKQQDGWVATHLDQQLTYPVDPQPLAALVKGLVNARLLEAKTSRQENYSRLGVASLHSQDSQATLLELSAGDKVWQLLVGNNAKSGNGSYVRVPQKKQSWLLDLALEVPATTSDWLQQPILALPADKLAKITLQGEGGWTITKAEQHSDNYQLQNMPADRQLQYPAILQGVANSISNLRFEQLTPFVAQQWQSMQQDGSLQVSTVDGQLFNLQLASQGAKHYLHIQGDDSAATYHHWQFEISAFAAGQLMRKVEDFLADLPGEQASGPQPPQ